MVLRVEQVGTLLLHSHVVQTPSSLDRIFSRMYEYHYLVTQLEHLDNLVKRDLFHIFA